MPALQPEALIARLARRMQTLIQRTEPGRRNADCKTWLYSIDLDGAQINVVMNTRSPIPRGAEMVLTSVREQRIPVSRDDHEKIVQALLSTPDKGSSG